MSLVESGKDKIGNAGQGLDSGLLANIRWTDKSFPATLTKQGANDKPDFDFVNLGLLFPQNNTNEIVYVIDQMWHTKKLGTALRLHVHFIQDVADLPNFTAEYRYYNQGDTPPAFTTINTDAGAGPLFTYTSGSILQIVRFPEIPAPVDEGVSANFEFSLYRNDNRVTGDVLVKFVDYHFQVDSDGSLQEFQK